MFQRVLSACFAVLSLTAGAALPAQAAEPVRPNIVWIFVDDMSPNFGCYGEQTVQTPHVDRLAREGTRFAHAFVTAPVCSACRSALITGMYQTTIGAHHHRSGRGVEKITLLAGVTPAPALFRQAGYYTCIGNGQAENQKKGKTDYNFEWDPGMYDGADWAGRKPGQPFFMQVQLHGGKHRDGNGWKKLDERFGADAVKPEAVQSLPPYYPRDPQILADWANYLDAVRLTDREVGAVLDRLDAEGLRENTLVVFMTDHGISHARGKQFLYNEGTHVPLVIRGPGVAAGAVREDLVLQIDLAALSLAAAGVKLPPAMQGANILAPDYRPRDAVFAARDRCDETVERLRSVRTDRYLYIRNFHPQRPHLQPNAYKDAKPTLTRLRELHGAGQLPELTEQLLFSPTRPPEELYEWRVDRWQVKNLAGDEGHRAGLEELRRRLDRWMAESGDQGPETASRYDSDMAVYLGKKGNPTVEKNIAVMKEWAKAGK